MRSAEGSLGVFDSGVGGLSVVRALRLALPRESILYVADSVNCPYGLRSAAEIAALSEGISRYLIAHGAKIIVVACNTASAAALVQLRVAIPDIPFVGMVPAVKPAAQVTRTGVVGVLATLGTLHGKLYEDVVSQHTCGVRVVSSACPGLVEMIEAGVLEGAQIEALLNSYLEPILAAGADTLVLGCTHYPFVIPAINRLYPGAFTILEPSEAVALQVARVLSERGLLTPCSAIVTQTYYTTGDTRLLSQALRVFLGAASPVSKVTWRDGMLADGGNCANSN